MLKQIIISCAALIALSGSAFAASFDSHVINFQILEINELLVEEAAVDMNVDASNVPAPGAGPDAVDPTVATVTLRWTTNADATPGKKITAQLDANMPGTTTLNVTSDLASAFFAALATNMSTTAVDVYTGISNNASNNDAAGGVVTEYGFIATVDNSPQTFSRTVTYTLTDQ